MKKVILVLIVASFTACHQKPAVETIVVGDSVTVKLDSVKIVDSLKVK